MIHRIVTYRLRCILGIVFVLSSGLWAKGEIVLDSLTVDDGQLCISFHINRLFDDKVTQGLERGFISEISHTVQLWQIKGLYSTIVEERKIWIRLYYDNWTQKYAVVTEQENRLTNHIETMIKICSGVDGLALTPVAGLGGKYYLTIQSAFQPISDETYGELRNWVSGDKDGIKKSKRRGRFFSFLVDLLGFGNRNMEFKSGDFTIIDNRLEFFIE